jgi:nucleotide-binding universal stress UspA family protein
MSIQATMEPAKEPETKTEQIKSASTLSPPGSPQTSPPTSPPAADGRRSPNTDYYSSRPRSDRFGNPLIGLQNRRPSAMSSVYGQSKIRLPGDLGAKDPRRARSPLSHSQLPGDLGPNDPRRPRSTNSSPAPSAHTRKSSCEGSEAGGRLEEDPPPPGEEQRDSDNDADADNDNDTDRDDEGKRGRERKRPEPGRTTSGKSINVREESVDSDADFFPNGMKPDPTKGQSKLSFQRDPKTKVVPPERKRVLPTTAFDIAPSGTSSPLASDDESHSELRAAQKLKMTMSPIHSTPTAHRVIRQIIRGDYEHFQREAEEGRKRQRMYLVSTDMSPEAEYALEWTIGTVLRDGDTLFAVYASDLSEVGGGAASEGGVEIGHGAESVQDTAATLRRLPTTNVAPLSPGPSPLARAAGTNAANEAQARSRSRGVYSAAETERRRAAEDITQRCMYLLRKTQLQVRVVVEVFHCKSPRHMITEVIDFLSPTLVIIGSRGRSAVKGVLLGSFSNYLVTKSSVPVMVARKKLRKHGHSQGVRRNKDGTSVPYSGTGRSGRFSNVIEAPRGKGLRVQGWDKVGID